MSVVQSIIPPAKASFRIQDNNACRKEVIVKRTNLNEQTPNERFDENIDLKATYDDPERKEIEFLVQKLANETLGSPQLQHNIKKLVNLNETLYNRSKRMKDLPVNRMKSVLKPTVSKRKLNKMLNKGKEKRKKNKRKYGLRRREKHPSLHKRNHVKVSKRKNLFQIFLNAKVFFYLNLNLIFNIYYLEETTENEFTY